MNTELRFSNLKTNDRTISGTAIVFNQRSKLLGQQFYEIIKPEAISNELVNNSDILFTYQHNDNNVPLARSKNGKGTLKIWYDNVGVYFSFQAKKTQTGDEMLEAIRTGDLQSMSFAFVVAECGDTWEKEGNYYLRTITKFQSLHDFSIVVNPAYSQATVDLRGLQAIKTTVPSKVPAKVLTPTEARELKAYHEKLKAIINKLKKN